MDSELQCYFKEYSDKTGRKPNWGIYVTSDLKNFLENHEKIPNTVKVELMNRISKINKNLEIVNFIKNQIKSAKLSQHEIISISRKMGLGMSKKTIKTARMLKRKREMSDYKRNAIIKDATAIDHDSGSKLIRKYKIGKKTFKDILIEAKGEKWYEKKYHAYERISSEKRRDMIKAATVKGHGSLPSLSREFKVDCQAYKKLLIEAKGKDWVEEEYPTLSEILSKKRKDIIKAGTAKNHPSLTKLSEMFNVSIGSIKKILEEEKGEEYVIEEFSGDIPIEKGRLTHKLAKSHLTKVFDERKKYSPEVPEMISEPPIYSGSFKRADIGFENISNYLQKLLIKNNLFERLNIVPKNIDHFEFVQFDFTNLTTEGNIIRKAIKYQHYKVMTFIVGTSWRLKESTINIPNDKAIIYPENLKVISYNLLADLLDLQGDEKEGFLEIIKLNEGNKIEALRKMWKNDDQKLHYAREDLKGFLENNTSINYWME